MDDILNLIFHYVKTGVNQLEQIGVGHSEFAGKYPEGNLCVLYDIQGEKYLIRIDKAKLDNSEPQQQSITDDSVLVDDAEVENGTIKL